MQADSFVVLALMAGFVSMLGVGVWAGLEDDTRDEIRRVKGQLIVAVATGVLLLIAAA
jgi:hypothetical protein